VIELPGRVDPRRCALFHDETAAARSGTTRPHRRARHLPPASSTPPMLNGGIRPGSRCIAHHRLSLAHLDRRGSWIRHARACQAWTFATRRRRGPSPRRNAALGAGGMTGSGGYDQAGAQREVHARYVNRPRGDVRASLAWSRQVRADVLQPNRHRLRDRDTDDRTIGSAPRRRRAGVMFIHGGLLALDRRTDLLLFSRGSRTVGAGVNLACDRLSADPEP